jgi:hypothetical protein
VLCNIVEHHLTGNRRDLDQPRQPVHVGQAVFECDTVAAVYLDGSVDGMRASLGGGVLAGAHVQRPHQARRFVAANTPALRRRLEAAFQLLIQSWTESR